MKVFSLKKFVEWCRRNSVDWVESVLLGWPIECNNQEVIDGEIDGYEISDRWTVEVNENASR